MDKRIGGFKPRTSFEEFKRRSYEAHGERYDYSKIDLKSFSMKNKVTIICPDHGEFEQQAAKHSAGQRCRECWRGSLIPKEEFAKRAHHIHGEKMYSYDKLPNEIRIHSNYLIDCEDHGEFAMIAYNHLKLERGCPLCSKKNRDIDYFKDLSEEYSYEVVGEFKGYSSILEVECRLHGKSQRSLSYCLKSYTCNGCYQDKENVKAKELKAASSKKFIEALKAKFANYKIDILNSDESMLVVSCVKHGESLRPKLKSPREYSKSICVHCQSKAKRRDPRALFKQFDLQYEEDYSVDGIAFDFYISEYNFALDMLWNGNEPRTPKEEHIYGINVRKYSDFLESKVRIAEKSGLNSKYFVDNSSVYKYFTEELSLIIDQDSNAKTSLNRNERVVKKKFTLCVNGHEILDEKKNCSYCSNRKVLCGFNDFGCRYPQVAKEWGSNNEFSAHEVVFGSNKKINWVCVKAGHEWTAPAASRHRGAGCPSCHKDNAANGLYAQGKSDVKLFKDVHPITALEIVDKTLLKTLSHSSHIKVNWICSNNHIYELSPNYRISGRGCPYCAGRKAYAGFNDVASYPEIAKELVNSKDASTPAWSKEPVEWQHVTSEGVEHVWSQTPNARCLSNAGCSICTSKLVVPGVNDVATTHPQIAKQWSENNSVLPTELTRGSNVRVELICPVGHEWDAKVKHATSGKKVCQDCRPDEEKFRSRAEDEVASFLMESFPELSIETTVRRFKSDGIYEYDMFIEGLKLAVDFNGTFWHQEQYKGEGYHARKRAASEALGFTLLEVWEDHWSSDRASVELALKKAIESSEFDGLLLGREDYS